MAKTIEFSYKGIDYTLEYTRKSVELMEAQGFRVRDVSEKPMTALPALFAGAFLAHHKMTKQNVINEIFVHMGNKEELVEKLAEMYSEPIEALFDEPSDGGGGGHPHPFFTYTEVFVEQVPYYMAIGMSWDEFWNGDCLLPRYYRKAHDLKRKEENEKLWLQGRYIYDAIAALSPVLKVNFSKKEVKAEPYSSEPYPITHEEIRIRKEREEQRKMKEFKAKTEAWAKRINARLKGGDGSGGE